MARETEKAAGGLVEYFVALVSIVSALHALPVDVGSGTIRHTTIRSAPDPMEIASTMR